MIKTAIVAVDDDPQVLAAVARDLRSRYGKDHRIIRAVSGAEALAAVQDLSARGDAVVVFVVDQRMPEMSGVEFLAKAREIFPDAKSVLLTAYADTQAAISAINDVDLDHYLLKPWDPPEERLYPVIDELIDEWHADHPPPYAGVRVIDTRWSPPAHVIKDFLARNRIPYRFYDVEQDTEARSMAEAAGDELPLIVMPDGSRLVRPDQRAVAEAVGLHTRASSPLYDLIVIGAGPAGLGAGVYAASEGLRTAIVERTATGGQAGTSALIENYLGFPKGISGRELAERAATQAARFGAEIITDEVTAVRADEVLKTVVLSDGSTVECRSLVVASGMTVRTLGVPAAEKLVGAGVYYGAAPSEAAAYVDEHVHLVGGANSAGQAALMLARYAARVTLLVRGSTLATGMSRYLIDRIEESEKIDVRLGVEVADAMGDGHLERLVLRDRATGEEETVESSGLFIFVGAIPHTQFLEGVVTRSKRGFLVTGPDLRVEGRWPDTWPLERDPYVMETDVPGIFAAGDVRDGVVRRVASAVGQGAVCVSLVHRYLETI